MFIKYKITCFDVFIGKTNEEKSKILEKNKKYITTVITKIHPIIGRYWKYFNDSIEKHFTHLLVTRVIIGKLYGQ